jgi:hypothetical protein
MPSSCASERTAPSQRSPSTSPSPTWPRRPSGRTTRSITSSVPARRAASTSSSTARPGPIGSAAVQLAHQMELAVTAACATEHLELVRRLGANRVVDYTAGDFTRDEQRYDIVFDAHGTPSYFACRKLLKPGGRYTSAGGGPFGMNLPLPLLGPLLGDKRVVFSVPKIDAAMVQHLATLLAEGSFTPLNRPHLRPQRDRRCVPPCPVGRQARQRRARAHAGQVARQGVSGR